MRRYRFIFLATLLYAIFLQEVSAQNYVTPVRNDITPPSPQSAAIVAVQTPEPDLLTGAVNVDIPIYTLQANDYSLPVSLKYHTNGIKVLDDPTPLGYGWTLLPALRATRTVYGRPDDLYPFVPTDPQSAENPMGMAFMCMASDDVQSHYFKQRYDSEHDVFTFALPSKTITRVLDMSSGSPVFKGGNDSEYKVVANADLSTITVTDPYANRYEFGKTYEIYYQDDGRVVRTAWALSNIYLDNDDQITFSWTTERHDVVGGSWLGGRMFMDNTILSEWGGATYGPEVYESDNYQTANFTRINECRSFLQLNSISFKDIQINFSYLTSGAIRAMTKIEVRAEGELRRTFNFTYEGTDYTLLKKIDGGQGQTYSFEYNTSFGTSPLTNWATIHRQDWWGYFNNKPNTNLTPKLTIKRYLHNLIVNGEDKVIDGADRSVDVNAMQAMILKKIVWPTGGTTSYVYEPHKFAHTNLDTNSEVTSWYNASLSEGGGLRVRSITTTTGSGDSNPITVSYQYPLATVRAMPTTASFVEIYEALVLCPIPDPLHPKMTTPLRQVNVLPVSNYLRYDDGVTPLWYQTVTAVYPEGKVVVTHEDKLAAIAPKPTVTYGKRIPNDKVYLFGVSPVMSSRKIYNSSGSLVEGNEYTYTARSGSAIISHNVTREKLFLGDNESSPDVPDGCYPESPSTNLIIDDAYSIRTYAVVPYDVSLAKTTTTEYAENGNFTCTQTFSYKSGTGLLSEVSESTSDGSVSKTQLTYPDRSMGNVALRMMAANCIGVPVREVITRGGTTTVAEAEYTLITSAPKCFRKKQVRIIHQNPADTIYGPVCTYNRYGHLIRSTDADGLATDWTWDEYNPTSKSINGLITKFDHKPLVGLSQVTTPWGTKTKYTYDGIGRLESVTIDGLGKISGYDYGLGNQSNYIDATTYLSATSNNVITELYDNLGRISTRMNSTTGTSQRFEYDNMGRNIRASVPSTASPGTYDYNLTAYEKSPRGKVVSTTKAGSEWHTGDKSVKVRTLVNTSAGTYACPRYSISSTGLISHHGNYTAASLLINEVTDENGHITRTYTDKSGLEVMSEEGKGSDMLRTRRVYDGYGRLRAILTPAVTDGNISTSDREFLMKCYEFGYDGAGKLISSRSPGMTKPNQSRYSRGGRVVAERTAAMADGKWLVHFYDAAGRLAVTDEVALSEAQLKTLQKTFSIASYTSATTIAGYTLTPAAPFTITTPLYASYYDTYDFRSKCADSQMPSVSGSRMGLQTGAYDGSNLRDVAGGKGYFAVMQYDDWGRLIRSDRQCDKGVLTDISTYDRAGNVLTYTHKLTKTDGTVLSLSGTNTLDGAGRVKKWTSQYGSSNAGATITYGTYGTVSKETFVNQAVREYSYDCHGWLTEIRNIPYLPIVAVTDLTSNFYTEATGTAEPRISLETPGSKTEKILYAEGTNPRYDGTASAHVSSLGGRYDFTYDNHDRLTAAAYSSTTRGENYSTEYSYNALGAPTSLKRKGRNTEFFGSIGGYGVVDDLTYSWDGAQLQSVTAQANGSDYYGRTGFPLSATGGTADFEFDAAGQMIKDTSRQISNITYSRQGLPTRVSFSDGSKVDYVYSFSGELKSMKAYSKPVNAQGVTQITAMRDYCGDFIFEDNALSMVNFPGGYFDSEGNPNYRHTDWQGNVTIVTNSEGKIAQHSGYYPYGEPWSEPSGQPYLYGGKERLREGALNEYDFGARRYNSALALWTTPDHVVHDQHSPYTYCAANPIRYIDPNGMEFTEGSKPYVEKYIDVINRRLDKLNQQIETLQQKLSSNGLSDKKRAKLENKIANLESNKSSYDQIKEEINALEKSDQTYNIKFSSSSNTSSDINGLGGAYLSSSYYNTSTNDFDIILGSNDLYNLAHELKHAYQFEIGSFSSGQFRNGDPFYDITDENEAYARGALFGQVFENKDRYKYLQQESRSVEFYSNIGYGDDDFQRLANRGHCVFRWNGKTYIGTNAKIR